MSDDILSDLYQLGAVDLQGRRHVERVCSAIQAVIELADDSERVYIVLLPVILLCLLVLGRRWRRSDGPLVFEYVMDLVQILNLEYAPRRPFGNLLLSLR